MRRIRWPALAGTALVLAGCGSVGSLTGAVVGAVSGTASGNPAVGVAVGIGIEAGMNEVIDTTLRHWQDQEQQEIATLVGTLDQGQSRPWKIRHTIPYGNAQGQVTVVRAYATALASCKEAVFSVDASVDAPSRPPYFTTTVCKHAAGWQWALAEPAVARWGALQ